MGSDLYSVSVLDTHHDQVTLSIQSVHPNVNYNILDDPGFALMLLHEAVPYGDTAPLSDEVSFEDTLDASWMRAYARGFIRDVEVVDVEHEMPRAAATNSEHAYWDGPWLCWSLKITASDATWLSHIDASSTWDSRAFTPSYDGYEHHEPILYDAHKGEVDESEHDVEGMFVWVPRECFADMLDGWGDLPRLIEMPALPKNRYTTKPLDASDTIDETWIGKPIAYHDGYSDEVGTITAVLEDGSLFVSTMKRTSYGSRNGIDPGTIKTLHPKASRYSHSDSMLDYDTILSERIEPIVEEVVCDEGDTRRVTFLIRTSPCDGTIPVETKTDALDLLMGSDWQRRDSYLREEKSDLTMALLADGEALEIETAHRLHEVLPFVAERYISSLDITPADFSRFALAKDFDVLTHAQKREALLEPWPTAKVVIEVVQPRWIDHVRAGVERFALRRHPLPAPTVPPEKEASQVLAPPDERVVLWKDGDKLTRWIGERRGEEITKRWGRRDGDRMQEIDTLRPEGRRFLLHRGTSRLRTTEVERAPQWLPLDKRLRTPQALRRSECSSRR